MAYGISGNFYFMALDKVTSNVLPLSLHMNKFQTPSISYREVILKIMPCVLFWKVMKCLMLLKNLNILHIHNLWFLDLNYAPSF